MKYSLSLEYILLAVTCLFYSCNHTNNNESRVVAKVYDKQLYLDDLRAELPLNMSDEDSIAWSKSYINSWIKSELLLKEAEKELSSSDLNVDKQLEKYRKSLLIYRYENSLNELIDTTITVSDIQSIYPSYVPTANTDSNLVKGIYFKFSFNQVDINTITRLSKLKKFDDLSTYGKQNAIEMTDYSNQWVDLSELLALMPDKPNVNKDYFSKKNYIESSDTDFYYFLCIYNLNRKNRRISSSNPNLNEDDIKSTIMYKRKLEFTKQLEEKIFEQAEASNNITIY